MLECGRRGVNGTTLAGWRDGHLDLGALVMEMNIPSPGKAEPLEGQRLESGRDGNGHLGVFV